MNAKKIMTRKIISVQKDESISEAANKMKQAGVGTVVVEDSNRNIVGIITDRDIVLRNVADNQGSSVKCGDIMTTNVVTASPETDTNTISRIMSEKQVKRVPIVEQNKIVGMVSLADISQGRGEEGAKALKGITNKQYYS